MNEFYSEFLAIYQYTDKSTIDLKVQSKVLVIIFIQLCFFARAVILQEKMISRSRIRCSIGVGLGANFAAETLELQKKFIKSVLRASVTVY